MSTSQTARHHKVEKIGILAITRYLLWRLGEPQGQSGQVILCEGEALASLRHKHLGSFFLNPEDIRVLGVAAIWNFAKGTRLL
jgi:hypothetical protein